MQADVDFRKVTSVAGACCTFSAFALGWLAPEQPWQDATGWKAIPPRDRPTTTVLWDEDAPELSWLGHSGFLLTWHGTRILIDPNTSPRCTVARRVLERPAEITAPVDAALISHAHYDHLDLPTLLALPRLDTVVVPAGSESYLRQKRWRVTPLEVGGRTRVGDLEVIAVPAGHNGNRFHPLQSRKLAVGYVIRSPSAAVFYAGDTGFGDHFAEVRDEFQPRAAILPIGAYAPRFPLKRYHLNPEEAVKAARVLGVETVVPCHFGTFVLSLDRPSWALPRFARAAREKGVRWMMPVLLREDK